MYEKELIALSKSGARYLVIGAVAMSLQGYVRATADLDITPDLEKGNLEKMISIIENLGYKPRVPVSAIELLDPKKREEWYKEKNMKVFSFYHPKNVLKTIDLMIYHPINFENCFKRKTLIKIKDYNVYVASIKDLLNMKIKAGRPQDKVDVLFLKRLKYKNDK
ncbi:MAG: hypothetical protein KKA64_00935 [Nanoarchaeota archaeon]|nr:hypothetical protein [Nanoarchaeota archaeon]